jgi:hypothetical protein
MAHFAELGDNNIVKQVLVLNDHELLVDGIETESKGQEFLTNLFGGNWKQTSINNSIRYNYASVGYTYDAVRDAFIAPKPDNASGFDENTCRWIVPEPEL